MTLQAVFVVIVVAAVLAARQPVEQALSHLDKAMPGLTETGIDDYWPQVGVVVIAGSLIFAGLRCVVGGGRRRWW